MSNKILSLQRKNIGYHVPKYPSVSYLRELREVRLVKKRFFCMSLILVMLLSVSAHAIQSRSITSVPHLSFDGNNASCVIQIVGDKMTDEISATMELRCGSDLIASWNGSGSGILKMTKSAAVKKGKTYTMVVNFSVNGIEQSPVTISATNG